MKNTLLAAVMLLTGCGGPLLFADLEIPEVGITLPQRTFPASSADPSRVCSADATDCIVTDLDFDVGEQVDVINDADAEYELRLTSVAIDLGATGAGTDLRGVRSVSIEALPLGASEPVVVASYVRTTSNPTPRTIAVSGDSNVDLAPFVQAGRLRVRAKMSLDAPTPEFTADVLAVFSLEVKLDYGAAVGL